MKLRPLLSFYLINAALAVKSYPKSSDKPITYEEYVHLYEKHYKNDAEYEHRKEIFEENMKLVVSHNEKNDKGILSHRLGVNQFSDLTKEERQARKKLPQESGTRRGRLLSHYTENEDYIVGLKEKYKNYDFPMNFSWIEQGKDY